MTKNQRLRAARSAGTTRPNPVVRYGAIDSHSDDDASGSESSASAGLSAGAAAEQRCTSDPVEVTGAAVLVDYDWYGEFAELCEHYRWQVAAYIAWAASPARGRKPATQAELAALLGYRTDRTIRKWRDEQPAIDEEVKTRQAGPLLRHRRDLFESLVNVAILGDVPALRLAFEMTGDYEPRRVPVPASTPVAPYTADELAAAEAELAAWAGGRETR